MYQLYIANKNYSSWSLRPWVLMRQLGIAFLERPLVFGDTAAWQAYRQLSPTGRVPCLMDGSEPIWDSLAIVEYLAEHHAGVWPQSQRSRAWARSAAAEMHAGFPAVREHCSMSCGVRVRLNEFPTALELELQRLGALWNGGLDRWGGPWLGGAHFSAVDAFYAPVAFRVQSYELALDRPCSDYVQRLLALGPMQAWYAAALAESARDAAHEEHMLRLGSVRQDLRSPHRPS